MRELLETPINRGKVDQLQRLLSAAFAEVLRRGYYGTASVEISIQDGTIQHIRSKLERIEK
ncbi:MAG: hypothetical protein K1X71_13225 [Pirellulales bacterium]|jgi:hypothetical protein|nr:hypothetical protein [Pirellulales bacterium]